MTARAFATALALSFALRSTAIASTPANDAVVDALRKRAGGEQSLARAVRLARDVRESEAARALAMSEDYDGARRALRVGALKELRIDVVNLEKAKGRRGQLRDVIDALDQFDDALRATVNDKSEEARDEATRRADAFVSECERARDIATGAIAMDVDAR